MICPVFDQPARSARRFFVFFLLKPLHLPILDEDPVLWGNKCRGTHMMWLATWHSVWPRTFCCPSCSQNTMTAPAVIPRDSVVWAIVLPIKPHHILYATLPYFVAYASRPTHFHHCNSTTTTTALIYHHQPPRAAANQSPTLPSASLEAHTYCVPHVHG